MLMKYERHYEVISQLSLFRFYKWQIIVFNFDIFPTQVPFYRILYELFFLFALSDDNLTQVLREKLRIAIKDGDKDQLERVINECVVANLSELGPYINRARDVLEDVEDERRYGRQIIVFEGRTN